MMFAYNLSSVFTNSSEDGHIVANDKLSVECLLFREEFPLSGWYPYSWIANAVVNFTLAPFTGIVNLLVVIAIFKTHRLQSVSNIILVSLSLTDMLTGFISQPLVGTIYIMASNYWISCPTFATTSIVGFYLWTVSYLTMACVMTDRFYAIFLPYRYRNIAQKKFIFKVLAFIWIFTGILVCVSSFTRKFMVHNYFTVIAVPVVFGWSFFVQVKTLILIRRIHCEVTSLSTTDSYPQPQHNTFNSATRLAFFILLAMWFCLLPKGIFYALDYASNSDKISELLLIAHSWANTAVLINSLLNPLIYCYYLREIRDSITVMLKWCFRRNPQHV